MAFKEWFQKLKPMQLYIMLVLTSVFFAAELIISHFTHSLTLLVDSYHMLCNMIALIGWIMTLKKLHPEQWRKSCNETNDSSCNETNDSSSRSDKENDEKALKSVHESENSLKNTFGWARIDILVKLIGCIFLASLCFSVLVEAIQTLIHIDHQDEMHFPLVILIVGAVGLLLNGFCYSLIGGYTFHQFSYLRDAENGEVILKKTFPIDSLKKGQRRLIAQNKKAEAPSLTYSPPQRQGIKEMIRDIVGCVFVIFCGSIIHFMTGHQVAKFLDPIISLFSATSLLVLSYPYMKESGLILMQTIPDDINIDSLRLRLLQAFPDIINVHDFHVWQLTADKIISTAHIIFVDPSDYERINKQITGFFNDQGITQLTVQPEFVKEASGNKEILEQTSGAVQCLMECLTDDCRKKHCCVGEKDEKTSENLQTIRIEKDEKTKAQSSVETMNSDQT